MLLLYNQCYHESPKPSSGERTLKVALERSCSGARASKQNDQVSAFQICNVWILVFCRAAVLEVLIVTGCSISPVFLPARDVTLFQLCI
jgi:hypothetical protein